MINLLDLTHDNDSCLDYLMRLHHGNPLECPECGRHGKFSRVRSAAAYQCSWCAHRIYPMAGTPFERSHTPLKKWFFAIYLITNSPSITAKEIQRKLEVTYKCAWRIRKQIKEYLNNNKNIAKRYNV